MQPALILFLMAVGSVAKIAVLWRAISSRLVRRHVLFCGMVTLSLARSILGWNGSLHPYQEFWSVTQWPMAVMEACAALEAFWLVADHFRNIRGFGVALLGVITIVAATVAAGVGTLRTYWNGALSGAVLFNQYTYCGLLVVTLLSLAFFWQFSGVPIRPNATRHLLALAILFGSLFVGNFLAQSSHGEWRFMSNLVITAGTIAAYSWWAIRITADGERLPFPPSPPMSKDEFASAEATDEKAAREIRRASERALSKVLRP